MRADIFTRSAYSPGKNSRRMTRCMNCTIPPFSVPLFMRAVLQFRGASSAVIFILPSVIRRERPRGVTQRNISSRDTGTEYFKGGIRAKCAYANDFSATGQSLLQSTPWQIFLNLRASTVANRDDNVSPGMKISGKYLEKSILVSCISQKQELNK